MHLVSYEGGFGRLEEGRLVPMGTDLLAYLAGREQAVEGAPRAWDASTIAAPVRLPGKIICIGLNYRDHAAETGKAVPSEPILFAKYATSVVPDGAVVVMPPATSEVDWEAELGVVIGRVASRVSVEDALSYVAGYTCMNDLSARDLQRSGGGQWTRGKAIDGFLPVGPVLVTADEIPDPQVLRISCTVNGETVQDSTTGQMAFGIAELVSFISQTLTLEPGDFIATGTPPGVGMAMTPPRFLEDGDVVVVEIERIGRLTTTMSR